MFSDEFDIEKSSNYEYIMNLIMEDYLNYFKASEYLQSRYEVCLHAIYSCLSKVNNSKKKSSAYKELSKFLDTINKKSGINMKIVFKEKLYVKEKSKRRFGY